MFKKLISTKRGKKDDDQSEGKKSTYDISSCINKEGFLFPKSPEFSAMHHKHDVIVIDDLTAEIWFPDGFFLIQDQVFPVREGENSQIRSVKLEADGYLHQKRFPGIGSISLSGITGSDKRTAKTLFYSRLNCYNLDRSAESNPNLRISYAEMLGKTGFFRKIGSHLNYFADHQGFDDVLSQFFSSDGGDGLSSLDEEDRYLYEVRKIIDIFAQGSFAYPDKVKLKQLQTGLQTYLTHMFEVHGMNAELVRMIQIGAVPPTTPVFGQGLEEEDFYLEEEAVSEGVKLPRKAPSSSELKPPMSVTEEVPTVGEDDFWDGVEEEIETPAPKEEPKVVPQPEPEPEAPKKEGPKKEPIKANQEEKKETPKPKPAPAKKTKPESTTQPVQK